VHVAVERGDGGWRWEAQLEPDEGYRRFELALAYVRGDRAPQTQLWPISLPM
jgi:hypothetical protein